MENFEEEIDENKVIKNFDMWPDFVHRIAVIVNKLDFTDRYRFLSNIILSVDAVVGTSEELDKEIKKHWRGRDKCLFNFQVINDGGVDEIYSFLKVYFDLILEVEMEVRIKERESSKEK